MADTLTSAPFSYPMGSFYGDLDNRIKVLEAAVGSGGGAVPDFSITTFKLADKAVTTDKIADDVKALMNGLPLGTIIDVYGNGTTTPNGFLKVIPGLEITNAYPELRAWALANGWATNGSGNPVFPSTDDALFKRQWRAGQTLRDAGRAFGTVQADAVQQITGSVNVAIPNSGANPVGAFSVSAPVESSLYATGSLGTGRTLTYNNANSPGARTASETRVANITVTWFIKAYSAPLDAATVVAAQVLADLADARTKIEATRKVAHLEDQKASGVQGGTSVVGWQTRTLNTKVMDPSSIVTLSSNQFTPAIPCECNASSFGHRTSSNILRVWNVTDNVEVARGPTIYSGPGADYASVMPEVRCVLAAGKTYRVEQYCSSVFATQGLGVGANVGTEIYTRVRLQGVYQ